MSDPLFYAVCATAIVIIVIVLLLSGRRKSPPISGPVTGDYRDRPDYRGGARYEGRRPDDIDNR